ncbi:MAG TPA: PhoH family protein [bacterium]|nr:PhoH family protein [bacterium]
MSQHKTHTIPRSKPFCELGFENDVALQIFGPSEKHLKFIQKCVPVTMKALGNRVCIEGDEKNIAVVEKSLLFLKDKVALGDPITRAHVIDALRCCQHDHTPELRIDMQKHVIIFPKKKIFPRTPGQLDYVRTIMSNDITLGIGPAGTGKTYLAMAVGMSKLLRGEVERIILTRPAVEAGERLGFLPGDLAEKVNPYLRPLYDALHDMIDHERAARMMASGQIEIAPIAFMRGRTLNDSYVILDEAQNCTPEQMKMFLTRLGENSQAVVTGDITQIDLPCHTRSGLVQALSILKNINGIVIHEFDENDVVRHPLVVAIIKAYERAKKGKHV